MPRITVELSRCLASDVERMSDEAGITTTTFFRQAFALLAVVHQARREGRHFGIASHADSLDTEIIW